MVTCVHRLSTVSFAFRLTRHAFAWEWHERGGQVVWTLLRRLRTNQSLGLPAAVATDFVNMDLRDDGRLSDEVQFYCDLVRVQGRAMTAFMRQASADAMASLGQRPHASRLHALIKSYDAELNRFASRLNGERSRFSFKHAVSPMFNKARRVQADIEYSGILHLNSGRLYVNSFLFFTANETQALDHDGLVELYAIAYKVIMGTKSSYHGKSSCPDYGYRTMLLAAFIILKLSRSSLADRVDLRAGEKAYFATILALRESSLENDDLCARGAMVLAQLWTSTRVFRRPDGVVDGLTLRVRSRLSMGIVFDCFWWWREEFQGKLNPYKNYGTPRPGSNGLFLPPLLPPFPSLMPRRNAPVPPTLRCRFSFESWSNCCSANVLQPDGRVTRPCRNYEPWICHAWRHGLRCLADMNPTHQSAWTMSRLGM